MIQSTRSQELVRVAREGTAQQYAEALRETGTQVLQGSIETFCNTAREPDEGKAALAQLKDLKNSLMTYIERNESETKGNLAEANDHAKTITAGSDPSIQLKAPATEVLQNAVPVYYCNEGYGARENLKRVHEQETVRVDSPEVNAMAGVRKFLVDMASVQGLYAAAVMIPGPYSATVKSVAKEMMTSSQTSSSSASGAGYDSGFGIGLLGIGARQGGSSFNSVSHSDGQSHYEKTTVDERVVPVLMDLQDRLAQVGVTEASHGSLTGVQRGQEYEGKKGWFSSEVKFSNSSITQTYYNKNKTERPLTSFEFQPAHVRLPDSGVSDFKS